MMMEISKPAPTDDVVPVPSNAEAWAQVLSSVFVELEFKQLDPGRPPRGRMYRYPFGDLTFVRAVTRGSAHRVTRSARMIERSTHNNFFMGFILTGEATLSQSGHHAKLHRGDIAILDSTREYAIDVPGSFDALWVRVPRHRLEGRLHSLSDIMAQRIDGNSGAGHVASSMLNAALAEAGRINASEANRIANHLLDLLGMALSSHTTTGSGDRVTSYQASTLRRIQEYIEQRLDDEDLSPDLVARTHSVSVRYLNKLFEREGISVAKWIRMRRLERCRQDLENPDYAGRSISEIAYNHGFRNISSFNRAFRARFGLSPRALRNVS